MVPGAAGRDHRHMMTSRSTHVRLTFAAAASLVPGLAFLAAAVLVDHNLAGAARAAPLYLLFLALPSMLPLAAARRAPVGLVVLVVMTVVAGAAGALMAGSDDA